MGCIEWERERGVCCPVVDDRSWIAATGVERCFGASLPSPCKRGKVHSRRTLAILGQSALLLTPEP
jgi:hypothetical protein